MLAKIYATLSYTIETDIYIGIAFTHLDYLTNHALLSAVLCI